MSDEIHLSQDNIAALQRENRLLWELINYLPYHVWVKDIDHRFVIINEAAAHLMDTHTIQDLIGKTDLDLHPPEHARVLIENERQLIETKTSFAHKEHITYNPITHQEIFLSTSKSPIYDEVGNVTGLVGYSEDITKHKQVEAQRDEQNEVIEAQQEALLTLSTPVLPVFDNILLIPLIGNMDDTRSRHMMRTVLEAINIHHAHILIIDVSGLLVIDTSVANDLNRMIQAATLKGAETIITGITDSVAETIIDLGIDWSDIETLRDLQSGLQSALQKQRYLS